jgi:hypothetical protein
VRVKGAFAKLCVAMNQQLVPVLNSAGFSSSDTPFRREEVRYEFRRCRSDGTEVVAVLFNRKREALFSVQLYIEPREGVPAFLAAGGTLHLAALSATRAWWPRGVVPFRAVPTLFDRSPPASLMMSIVAMARPAPFTMQPNFLDVGGGANAEQIKNAFLRGHRVLDLARPIQQFAALLPHAEDWFRDRTRSRFIVDGRLAVRRPA